MTTTTRRAAAIVLTAFALTLTLAACAPSAPDEPSGYNAADTQFAQMMIIHHKGAIKMARVAAENATTPQVTALAERITEAQGPEIAQMTNWLTAWGDPVEPAMVHAGMDHGGMEMDGMTQADAMHELAGLGGTDVDRRFLELMTAHHEGAVTMAQAVIDTGQNEDVRRLAQQIIDAQSAEIAEMADLLGHLSA